MKTTINNPFETMNAPQMLSINEMNNVAGGGHLPILESFLKSFSRSRRRK